MHSFHVFFADGTEKNFAGANHRVGHAGEYIIVTEGLTSEKDPAGLIFAPGTWTRAELERRDDKSTTA
jgi:hypothetical protein